MPSESHQADPPPRPSVFLSYASADRSAARVLRDTLAAAGLEVWLDEDELGGGEAWDAKIRNQIRTCTYFMPVISATTEARREGYFRREWRFAVERTLDLADDVMFLVPVAIDATRDAGARVPEKFFSVQWLRVPGGAATPELRELAAKLATGEAVAVHPVALAAGSTPPIARKADKEPAAVPPFPKFPAFPEPGHRLRFCYDLVLWGGHLLHVFWLHLPRKIRILAAVVIVFNAIAWVFSERSRTVATKPNKSAMAADLAKKIQESIVLPPVPGETPKVSKSLAGAAEALQSGRQLAVVNFNGTGEGAGDQAQAIFSEVFKRLQQHAAGKVSLSPLPLDADDDDDDVLARGTKLVSKFVLTGSARREAPGQPLVFTAKLYDVKLRSVVWAETYDPAQLEAAAIAQRIVDAVQPRAMPAAQP